MTKPTSYYPWATLDDTYDIIFNGVTHTVPYKAMPVVGDTEHDFTDVGILYNVRVPVQYINWQMNGAYQWIVHLDQRLVVGDVYITSEVETEATINEQLGGGWLQIGTVTQAWGTDYYWKKTF